MTFITLCKVNLEIKNQIDLWLKGIRCDISAELMSIGFSNPNLIYFLKIMGNQVGVSKICTYLFMASFVKQRLGRAIKKTCLIIPEQNQSPKTDLRMFKFDNKLIWKNNLQWRLLGCIRWRHQILTKQSVLKRNMRCYKKLHANVCHSFAS